MCDKRRTRNAGDEERKANKILLVLKIPLWTTFRGPLWHNERQMSDDDARARSHTKQEDGSIEIEGIKGEKLDTMWNLEPITLQDETRGDDSSNGSENAKE